MMQPQHIGIPDAEVEINSALVQQLLIAQHPDLADFPLALVGEGWDNVIFRLGDRAAIRLPRRALAAKLIEHEQTWLPMIASQVTLPVPMPLRCGKPTEDYPWCWSVIPWLDGTTADRQPPRPDQAIEFAHFLRSLHQCTPTDAPVNPFRGVALSTRAAMFNERMTRLGEFIPPQIHSIWQAALVTEIDVTPTLIHGDLHPRNVLIDSAGALSGIIDWGDLTSGDRANDLAAIWMLFDTTESRQAAFSTYGPVSAATYVRSQGWAIFFGVVLLDAGLVDDPTQAAIGKSILARIMGY